MDADAARDLGTGDRERPRRRQLRIQCPDDPVLENHGGEPSRTQTFHSPNTVLTTTRFAFAATAKEWAHAQAARYRKSPLGLGARVGRRRRRRDRGRTHCDHRAGQLGRPDLGDGERHRQSRRAVDVVVRRVRHQHELRVAECERERRCRIGQRRRLSRALRARVRHDLPLPRRRHERRGHEPRCRRALHDLRRSGGRDGRGDERHPDLGDAQRQRRPERARDDVVLRVRDEHELRDADGGEGRRLGRQRRRRLGARRQPRPRPRLPLPARRNERCGDEPRRRPNVLDDRRARGDDRRGIVRDADVGALERDDHSEWPVDELVLRLRDEHELRRADGGQERRLGDARHAGERLCHAPANRRHLPLSPRGDERLRDDRRPRPDVQHGPPAGRAHGCSQGCDRDDRDPDRLGRPADEGDDLVVRVRHIDRLRLPDAVEKRGLWIRPCGDRGPLGTAARHHVPLPPRRAERRRHEPRRQRLLHDRGRHPDDPRAPGRLRPRDPALGVRADTARRRDRDRVRAAARRGLAQVGRDRPDRGRRELALACEAADPHVLCGAVGGRAQRCERRRRPARRLAPSDRDRPVLHARPRRPFLRGTNRAAAAAVGDRTLDHDQARPLERALARR